MSWHAVDVAARTAVGPGRATPAAALGAVPVSTWPLAVVADDGRRVGVAEALGPGGAAVARLLGAPVAEGCPVETSARATPAGRVDLPVAVVAVGKGVEAAADVDLGWLAEVDRRRSEARRRVLAAGRAVELEAALHLAVLLATERFDPTDDGDVDAHVASGARLWLWTGAVVSALAGLTPDPFESWARLVADGWWPVGPSGGRLVLSASG